MPWKAYKEGDKYVVRKTTPDNKPGEKVAEHDSKEDADAQVAALYASEKTQESTRARTGYFSELADLIEGELSDDGSIARVTLIRPGWSANGRYYSKDVLAAAAPLFEGGQAYADHPSRNDRKDRPERSVRDLVGWFDSIRQEADGRVTGAFHVVQEWLKPIIRASVKENSKLAGLSINALGETRPGEAEGKRGIIVESIIKHNSTDVVTTPAAGGKFDALLASDGDSLSRDLIEAMPLDELTDVLREARPDLIKALQKEWKTPRDDKAVSAARAEADKAKKELAESKQAHRAMADQLKEAQSEIASLKLTALVDRLLADSKLPKEWRSDVRAQLMEAKDERAMLALIDRELSKASHRPRPLNIRGSSPSVAPAPSLRAARSSPIADLFGIDPILTEARNLDEFVHIKQTLKG